MRYFVKHNERGEVENLVKYAGSSEVSGMDEVPLEVFEQLSMPAQQETYREQRAREYPQLRDQLDAIWKGGEEADAMRARVMAVKALYPK